MPSSLTLYSRAWIDYSFGMAVGGTTASCILLLCLALTVQTRPIITWSRNVGRTEWTGLEAGVNSIPNPSNWTSVPITKFGNTTFDVADTFSFSLPNVIPDASEVLVNVGLYTEGSVAVDLQDVRIFTQIGTTTYDKYLTLYTSTSTFNTNSDNMWFPMPPNRRVLLALPTAVDGKSGARLSAIGYR